jgi:2-succinyl-5-enolpyruvyl-6-hydroxy-3-cyclohexene-1-carboxylate synthase
MTLQATFCATLVDEWVRAGVRRAVIAPGSRSSPLAIALLTDGRIETHVRLDERSAGFFALGIALDSGEPVIVLTTSGTAASEIHPAVLEADLARIPLIVVTADRPFELHGVGAPQTIAQGGLYGTAVRLFVDPGVADVAAQDTWRSFASRLVVEAIASPRGPGPVHLNLPFRDPLVGVAGPLPAGRPDDRPWHEVVIDRGPGPEVVKRFVGEISAKRGIVVIGGPFGPDGPGAVLAFTEALGWPAVADPRALARRQQPTLIAHADGVIRSEHARAALRPEIVVHLGSPHASKVLATWCGELAHAGVPQLLVDPFGAFEDPERGSSLIVRVDPVALLRAATGDGDLVPAPSSWLARWRAADDAAESALAQIVDASGATTEPGIARAVFAAASTGAAVIASSSMPVRDLEWFAAARPDAPVVISNRGANGIDGVTSTILGVATSANARGGTAIGMTGDLAFLYDLSGLVFGTHEAVPDATIVVVDNSGGGIFSFLPYTEVLDDETFDRAFGTPQRPDLAATVRALGHSVVEVATTAEVASAVAHPRARGISVVIVRTVRSENVTFHADAEARVSEAVSQALRAIAERSG